MPAAFIHSFTYITTSIKNRVGYISLNRPSKRNAFNNILVQELTAAFNAAATEDAVKVIVLRAEGEVFSAGADLSYLQSLQKNTYNENLADSTELAQLFALIYEHPKVIIAQVQGHAIAGGCGLATVCDFVFAADAAKFGYTEVKIGFIPAIVMVFLLRKLGEGAAKSLLLSGRLIDANTAKQIGLINEVVNALSLQEYTTKFAERLCASTSAQAIALTKAMIANIPSLNTADALAYAAAQNAHARASKDCKHGIASFLNKEKIIW